MYGIIFKNWRAATTDSLIFTVPLMLLVVLYKLLIMHFDPSFHHGHLFDMTLNLTSSASATKTTYTEDAIIIILYLVFVPIQELITRGALQSSLQILLVGKHKKFWSVLVSNLLFSATHLHLSLTFASIISWPGLFWGWLYSRHRSLVGVTLSHLILGAWAIFIAGIF